MKTPKDTDLREALRRKYAREPQLPADFISRMNSQQKRRWLLTASAIAVAASVLLLIMLNTEKQQTEQQMPSIAEVMTEPQATAPTEVTEQKQPAMAHAEKPKPRRRQKPAVQKETIAEPPAEEAVPVEMPAEDVFPEDRLLDTNNPYLVAAAQLQDVRARGERLDREVAMLMNRP
ncbi:MAG: hypothetical protein IJ640_07275 [Prevotella sp.]|nr:hypothetical protein [Prevotella sp.]